jgi:hypothetical protein
MILYILLMAAACSRSELVQTALLHVVISSDTCDGWYCILAAGGLVARLLLIIAGDVELNPGPVAAEELNSGLATLITEAPTGVKLVLGVWAPDKVDMVSEWNSGKFTVPVLKEAMAWLQNTTVEEVAKQLRRKSDLATALPVAIERLLPDECGGCHGTYSVGRVENPTLQCAGCHQGIHEDCLKELLGEGLATMSTLHGTLTWLCQVCAPNYKMMTVLTSEGQQRPTSRRKAGNFVPVSSVQNSVEDIADQMASLSVSNSDSHTESTSDQNSESSQPSPQPATSSSPRSADQGGVGSDIHAGPTTLGVDCQLFIQGDCPHGVSGRKGGVCAAVHRKRCTKFLRWGSKADKGCKDQSCINLHPAVCPASLDLKCLNVNCKFKLHIQRCKRKISESSQRSQSQGQKGKIRREKSKGQGKVRGAKPSSGQARDGESHPGCCECAATSASRCGAGNHSCQAAARKTGQGRGSGGEYPSPVQSHSSSKCDSQHCKGQSDRQLWSCHTSCDSVVRDPGIGCNGGTLAQCDSAGNAKCDCVTPAGKSAGQTQGFHPPTVQLTLEAWLETMQKDMMHRQDTMMQMLRAEMLQPRQPLLSRGPFGLHHSF